MTYGKSSSTDVLNAAFSGDLGLLRQMKFVEEVLDEKGRTALHFAASGGKPQVCNYLIEKLKMDVNCRDYNGETPLHLAVYEEQYLTITRLLNHGAQINAANNKGVTPLHYAAERGRKDQLRLLIANGAEVDAQSIKGTPLQCAAGNGMADAVKILLDNHAKPNTVAHQAYTPLSTAILAESVECVRLLIKGGADPNQGGLGVTPLIMAAGQGETEIIKCLLKAGADANLTNFYGFTPIEMAAMNGKHADVMALFDATTPIPSIPRWSIHGILEYVNSAEAKNKRELIREGKSQEAKTKGTEAVKRKDYLIALYWYTEALSAKPMDWTLLSNRSHCWAKLNEGDNALEDAMSCISLKRDWPRGYYRAGTAWRIKLGYKEAAAAFKMGLKLDPTNKELLGALKEVEAELGNESKGNTFMGHFTTEDDRGDKDENLDTRFSRFSVASCR